MSTNRNNPNRYSQPDSGRPTTSRPSASVGTRHAPVISAEQARREGVKVSSLIAVAQWNERWNDPRRKAQAAELRRVAAELAASNDNARNDARRVA
jgi:hypothetical protein